MKKKILIVVAVIFFAIAMISLNIFFNLNKLKKNDYEKNTYTENETKVIQVTHENFEEEVLNSDKTVIVEFYADWCSACRKFSPTVEAIANENDNVKVVKINVDEEDDIATRYKVIYLPTTVIIKDGKEINRVTGIISKDDLLEMLK